MIIQSLWALATYWGTATILLPTFGQLETFVIRAIALALLIITGYKLIRHEMRR